MEFSYFHFVGLKLEVQRLTEVRYIRQSIQYICISFLTEYSSLRWKFQF